MGAGQFDKLDDHNSIIDSPEERNIEPGAVAPDATVNFNMKP
jgi:hypothetical protein